MKLKYIKLSDSSLTESKINFNIFCDIYKKKQQYERLFRKNIAFFSSYKRKC
jgi:hypothetical protein